MCTPFACTNRCVLTQDELRRRLIAGRTLRGIGQDDLSRLLMEDGMGKYDLGRIERGEKDMQATHRRTIAHHLRLPESWFTEPEVDTIVSLEPNDDTIRRRLDAVLDQIAALQLQLEADQLDDDQADDRRSA